MRATPSLALQSSTQLWEQLSPDVMDIAIAQHHSLARRCGHGRALQLQPGSGGEAQLSFPKASSTHPTLVGGPRWLLRTGTPRGLPVPHLPAQASLPACLASLPPLQAAPQAQGLRVGH